MKPKRQTPYGEIRAFWELDPDCDIEDGAKAALGIPRKFWKCYLDRIEPKNAEQTEVINALNFMLMSEHPFSSLIVCGGNGTGKSLLGASAVNLAAKYGPAIERDTGKVLDLEPLYVNEADLLNRVESYQSRTDWFGIYTDQCRLLVVDEFGMTQWNATDKRKMEQVLNKRFSNDYRTVILTNLNISQVYELFSSQLRSRFMTGRVLNLTGPDLRVREAYENNQRDDLEEEW